MKALIFFLTFLMPLSLFARDCTLEVRGAYYSPSSKAVRNTYSSAWIDYEVFASKRIANNFDVWAEVDWAIKRGHTSRGFFGVRDRTRAWVLPVSAGFRFIYPITCRVDVYLGGGVSYSFLKIDNRCEDYYDYSFYSSSPFRKHIRRSGVGGVGKVGILIDTCDNTFIDIFVDYYSQRFHLGHHDTFEDDVIGRHFNASGFKIGGGFGVRF